MSAWWRLKLFIFRTFSFQTDAGHQPQRRRVRGSADGPVVHYLRRARVAGRHAAGAPGHIPAYIQSLTAQLTLETIDSLCTVPNSFQFHMKSHAQLVQLPQLQADSGGVAEVCSMALGLAPRVP